MGRKIHISTCWNEYKGQMLFCGIRAEEIYPYKLSTDGINTISFFNRQEWHKYCLGCLVGAKYSSFGDLDKNLAQRILKREYPEHK